MLKKIVISAFVNITLSLTSESTVKIESRVNLSHLGKGM